MTGDCQAESAREDDQPPARAELVSAIEIVEYRLEADGGLAGNVADLILDGKTWIVRYFVVGTGEEDTSKQVLLATQLMDPVSFDTFAVYADVSAEVVLAGPDFDPSLPINKESGEVLRDHFSC